MGVIEVVAVLGVLVAASLVVVGAYFLIPDRRAASDYSPTPDSKKEKKSITQLLRFNPDVQSTILALIVWAGIIALTAILVITLVLFLGRDAFANEAELALTHPSSILVGPNLPHIRLIPGEEACQIRSPSDESEQLQCDVPFENALLALNVKLEDGTFWYCSAEYDGQSVPCQASFDSRDSATYIIVKSNLGLSEERFRQLAEDTANAGWSESDSIWLARGIVTVLSLGVFALLWRHSGKRTNDHSTATVLRVVYSAGISLMFFGIANYVSFAVLLVFNLID
jgi:hypothetical protein